MGLHINMPTVVTMHLKASSQLFQHESVISSEFIHFHILFFQAIDLDLQKNW